MEDFGPDIARTLRSDGGYDDLDFYIETDGTVPLKHKIGTRLFKLQPDGSWKYMREATAEERYMWEWAIRIWDRI